jgi:hypothetical protein
MACDLWGRAGEGALKITNLAFPVRFKTPSRTSRLYTVFDSRDRKERLHRNYRCLRDSRLEQRSDLRFLCGLHARHAWYAVYRLIVGQIQRLCRRRSRRVLLLPSSYSSVILRSFGHRASLVCCRTFRQLQATSTSFQSLAHVLACPTLDLRFVLRADLYHARQAGILVFVFE